MNIKDYPDSDLMAMDLADQISADLVQHLFHHDRALLIVPGGRTPVPIFDVLYGADLPWDRVDVIASDERWVPPEDPQSNGSMIRRHLLQGAAQKAHFLDLYMTGHSPQQAAGLLAQRLAPRLPAAVALLGMGADLHFASLFPGGDHLDQAMAPDAPAVLPMRPADISLAPRVTLCMPALQSALSVHVVFTGEDKRRALMAATGDVLSAPILAIKKEAQFHWAP